MKSFSLIALFAILISFVFADAENFEITYYGCPDECYTQRNPACDSKMKLGEHDYFAALSTDFDFERYCKKYVVAMLTNGKPTMIKAKIVDSCGDCSKYHVDLSETAFKALTPKKDGVANIIWGVFSSEGEKLAGPYQNRASRAAEKFKISEKRFLEAFDYNAKKLAASSSNHRDFDPSAYKTTTTTTTTTTTITTTTTTTTTTNVSATEAPTATPEPQKPVVKEAINEVVVDNEEKPNYTAGIITLGTGSAIGAAGLGILLLKKKNPTQYEDLKQKFPEAFSNVKRGLTRGATQIKNKMSKKTTKQPTLPTTNEYTYTAPENLITF